MVYIYILYALSPINTDIAETAWLSSRANKSMSLRAARRMDEAKLQLVGYFWEVKWKKNKYTQVHVLWHPSACSKWPYPHEYTREYSIAIVVHDFDGCRVFSFDRYNKFFLCMYMSVSMSVYRAVMYKRGRSVWVSDNNRLVNRNELITKYRDSIFPPTIYTAVL